MRRLELLAPAKNLQCGIAAIDCGADAVYIGAPKFGARASAGNSLDDIKALVDYARRFEAKVYVTLNTIIYDSELDEMKALLARVYDIGVDAVLIQDMALMEMAADSGLVLHASTQIDNRSARKVSWLKSLGFKRIVLARELSLDEIRAIHEAHPDVELEAFVHGALCVSYSGACYASQYCFGRSANRGECAQFCRMKFDLIDTDGRVWEHGRHLLSLKDLAQINHLEELADAGVVSFKIEGRLKDEDYVKNVVAAYSQRLDRICAKSNGRYERASIGKVSYGFTPNLEKTFNRGFTNYFLNGRESGIFSPDTPKAMGEYVGKVKELRGRSFNVAGLANFSNGDGLCFINSDKELEGFRVNRVEGNRLFPLSMPRDLKPGTALYRNHDVAFQRELSKPGTERKIGLNLTFSAVENGFELTAKGRGVEASAVVEFEHQPAQKPQRDNIVSQLSRWGGTVYAVSDIEITPGSDQYFLPSSKLSELRQRLSGALAEPKRRFDAPKAPLSPPQNSALGEQERCFDFKNVSNRVAEDLHKAWGVDGFQPAPEVDSVAFSLPLMQCRHCLRFALGYCVKHGGRRPEWREPLFLRLGDGRRFRLEFDCKLCQMEIYGI